MQNVFNLPTQGAGSVRIRRGDKRAGFDLNYPTAEIALLEAFLGTWRSFTPKC
jgi:hypothetical protein